MNEPLCGSERPVAGRMWICVLANCDGVHHYYLPLPR